MSRESFASVLLILLGPVVQSDGETWSERIQSARDAQHAGEYQRAKTLFSQALGAAEKLEGGESERVETEVQLAELLLELGKYGRCEQLCLDALAAAQKQHSEQHLHVAQAEKVLAWVYVHLGMAHLAGKHCHRGLKVCESIRVKMDPDTAPFLALMRQIWNLNGSDGNSNGGQTALRILEKAFGKSDPRLIVALEAEAGDCYERWTPAEAARAVSIAQAAYGERHPIYGRCLLTQATALRSTRDFAQAEVASKQAIEILSNSLGKNHPGLSAAYRNLASVERERGHSDQADSFYLDSIRLRFSGLSDVELCHFYDQLLESDQYNVFEEGISDLYLTECVRRGGEVIAQSLAKKIADYRRKVDDYRQQQEQAENANGDGSKDDVEKRLLQPERQIERYHKNLYFVTALCRIQQKPDPLRVFVDDPNQRTHEFPELPVLDVTIKNVDVDKRQIGFQQSGNYRSGRQQRWRIQVRDVTGKVHASLQPFGSFIAGGMYQNTVLKPAEGWQTALTMAHFVETLEPGEYQVRVLYHNDATIVDWEFVTGQILCRSEPFRLTIKPRSIETTKAQQQEIKELLRGLDDRQSRKVIDGKYGRWAHKFIEPQSECGQLLTLGWPAVPALIEELGREDESPERRAQWLALLFSITGQIDPRSDGLTRRAPALGSFSMVRQGWVISSKRESEPEPSSSSFELASGPSTYNAKLDAKAQLPFIERWQTFRKHLEVTTRD